MNLEQERTMKMNLEHNEEVPLMAPLQMLDRYRDVRLEADEGHQDRPET